MRKNNKISWEDYETNFITALKGMKESGINIGLFGDII
jgi:hypothetical protein